MPISTYEQDKSKIFMSSLNKILEIIEELSAVVPEGKYLEICDNLKILNDNKGIKEIIIEFQNNPVVRQHRQRTNMSLLVERPKNRILPRCPDCDTQVSNIALHKKTMKCKLIKKTKKLSAYSGKLETANIYNMVEVFKFIQYIGMKTYHTDIISNWKNNLNN
tara:strand:+ start:122 stop:610 length:489 start_codon:yes stop_codon:yes gene_type:complete